MRHFAHPAELAGVEGVVMGPGDWYTVTQRDIDLFADATGDHQWIHVDAERAAREAPTGTTIAHGLLSLSLIGRLQPSVYVVDAGRVVNYGIDRVRFLSPVAVGSRLRQTATVLSAVPASGGLKVVTEVSLEIEGAERPALVAQFVFLYFP